MATLKDAFTQGVAKINIKTNNIVEGSKTKTMMDSIRQQQGAIAKQVGEVAYVQWKNNEIDFAKFEPLFQQYQEKEDELEQLDKKLKELESIDAQIFGKKEEPVSDQMFPVEERVFCMQCGAQNSNRFKFCRKCGNPINVDTNNSVEECQKGQK